MQFNRSDCFMLNYSINFLSSITLILVSKWFFRHYPISGLTLTIFDACFTGLLASITLKLIGNSSPIPNRTRTVVRPFLPIAASFAGYLTFSNLSLQYNSIVNYQLIKLQVPFTLMIFEFLQIYLGWNSAFINDEKVIRHYSIITISAFIVIFTGTVFTVFADFFFHPWGLLFGFLGVIFNAIYQNFIQLDSSVTVYDRMKFLQIVSFLSLLFLVPLWPILDPTFEFNEYLIARWTPILALLICGLSAFLVNTSSILCIKDDAPIGFNLTGQLKSVVIVFLGSTLFAEYLTMHQIAGISGISVGWLVYTYKYYKNGIQNQFQTIHSVNSEIA